MKTKDGVEIGHVPDGMKEDEFVGITENPFGHGCCECGLWHKVEVALADKEGNILPLPEGTIPAMRWVRDQEQTEHFRAGKIPTPAKMVMDHIARRRSVFDGYYPEQCDAEADKDIARSQFCSELLFEIPGIFGVSTYIVTVEPKTSPEAAALCLELVKGVSAEEVANTQFSDVPINELSRDALLRIITLLAAENRREEPSRIIRL